MSTVAGIFNSTAEAERVAAALREGGFGEEHVSLLTPGTTQGELDKVPTTETEQPGRGTALGGAVGGALGVAGGLHLGAAAASLLVPGVGPVLAVADDETHGDTARGVLAGAGAESVDAARESWWVGLRDAEEAEYTVDGGDFGADEPVYRRGFESALHPQARGRAYGEDAERLRECYGAECEESAFRRGYERGRRYHSELSERYKG